jgi:hypothetical protein
MKRKVLALALALTLVTAFGASAYTAAVGAEFAFSGLGNGLPGSAAFISFRLPKFPAVFGIGGTIASSGGQSSLALLADWWLAQGKLVNFVDYYVGPGLFADFSSAGTIAGLRVPFGIDGYPIKPLELFLEIAPSFEIIQPKSVTFGWSGFQTGFGFRFWF